MTNQIGDTNEDYGKLFIWMVIEWKNAMTVTEFINPTVTKMWTTEMAFKFSFSRTIADGTAFRAISIDSPGHLII